MNRFARSPPRRIWGKFSNPTPIVEKATPNIVMKSRRGNVVEDPCPVGCDAISKRPRKSATHPTRTMRTPQTRNASSVMLGRVRCIPVVEGKENHLVSVVRLLGNRVPKAFMAYAANRPFRSRSLVRSRIGAFRASDAGSNPAGSMLFFRTLLRPVGDAEDLRRDLERIPESFGANLLVSRAGLAAEEMPVPCNSVPIAEAGFASTHFRGKSTHRRRTLPLRS